MRNHKHLYVEFPDDEVTIDFAGLCSVRLVAESGKKKTLLVTVKGCDDRATILMDQMIELPEPDERE